MEKITLNNHPQRNYVLRLGKEELINRKKNVRHWVK